jgi:GDP-mannose 6-dehydrogenase
VILAEALLGKGCSLSIYDKNVSLARLVGANKEYIEKQIPHLSSLLRNTIDEVVAASEVIVVGNQASEFAEALTRTRADHIVIDLVRLPIYGSLLKADYRGICW